VIKAGAVLSVLLTTDYSTGGDSGEKIVLKKKKKADKGSAPWPAGQRALR
jgi:hypothetical protein